MAAHPMPLGGQEAEVGALPAAAVMACPLQEYRQAHPLHSGSSQGRSGKMGSPHARHVLEIRYEWQQSNKFNRCCELKEHLFEYMSSCCGAHTDMHTRVHAHTHILTPHSDPTHPHTDMHTYTHAHTHTHTHSVLWHSPGWPKPSAALASQASLRPSSPPACGSALLCTPTCAAAGCRPCTACPPRPAACGSLAPVRSRRGAHGSSMHVFDTQASVQQLSQVHMTP